MATLTVNLSTELQATLHGPGTSGADGINAWVVNFDHATGNYQASYALAGWDGSTSSQVVNPTTTINVAEPLNGGKYYVIIQSTNGSPLTFGPSGDIATESDINWDNAAQYDFRYDSFEFSLLGQAGDAGNLTDVNGFGIPMSVEVSYGNGAPTQTRGYAVNGASIFTDIGDINGGALVHTYTDGPLFGEHRMAASPATALAKHGPGGASAADWTPYVESLGANGASDVRIAGYFNGAYSDEYTTYNGQSVKYHEYHNGGFYSYKLTWEQGTGTAGTYVFKPEANSQIKGEIHISTADLGNSIYSTLGNAHVLNPDGTKYQFSSQVNGQTVINSDMNTGANNEWGAFFVKLLTGFIGGYLGGTHTPENSLLGSGAESLSHNWNFDPTFAFGGQISAGQPGAVTQWKWSPTTYGTHGVSFDPYAKIFFDNSNSYGNGYSDAVMSLFQQGGPLIPTGYSEALPSNPFTTIQHAGNITVSDPNAANYHVGDLVTFNNVSGPVGGVAINNNTYSIYSIDTASSTYQFSSGVAASQSTSGGGGGVTYQKNIQDVTLTLFDDNQTAATGQTLAQTQGYTPTVLWNDSAGPFVNPQSGGTGLSLVLDFSGITNYRVDPSSTITIGFYTGQSGGQATFNEVALPSSTSQGGLYQTWVYSGGAFTAGGAPAASGAVLNVNNLPYATGVNWYQIEVSNGGVSRTYNLYAKAVAGVGVENPYYSGANQAGSIALDNLAAIPIATLPSTTQYFTNLTIAAFSGGTLSMDPSLLTFNPTGMDKWTQPLAPVLGTIDDSVFSNWGGSENLNNPNTNLSNVTDGELAFGWQGSDMTWVGYNAFNSVQVLEKYTNKVSGLDGALITFAGTSHNSIQVTADIDGKWTMGAESQFGNGQYTAYMTEYDSSFATQLGRTSAALNFTVALEKMGFANTGHDFIQLDGSGSASGNWVRLDTVGSTMPNGTLLAYITDLNGNLVGRDGETGAGVTFDEALVARIGSVATDGGGVLFQGGQSVYLKVGQQLHFAVQTGNDVIQRLPNVQVTGNETLSVKVAGAFGTLDLSAHVDNTLSHSATLAGSQREYNEPWFFLNQGQQLHVDVAGSAQNVNTIHFVHLDVDRAGNWSVGGVGYGNTDAFRAAVQANWDPGFVSSGGRGNFHDDGNWTASKGTGFYAPVLVTEGGDIFVIGKANVDGRDHIRSFGENTFGFEDLRADQHSDFDYNDLVMKLSVL